MIYLFNAIWFIITFFIPIFQSYFAGEFIHEDGKINFKSVLKSKLLWILLVLWIIGNCLIAFYNSSNNNNNTNKIDFKGDGNTVINGDINGNIYTYIDANGDTWTITEKNNGKTFHLKTEEEYLDYLDSVLSENEQIAFYDYNDYDGDGIYEMFALIGETNPESDAEFTSEIDPEMDPEFDNISGDLWFISQTGAQKIEYNSRTYWSEPNLLRIGGQCFLALEQFFTTGSVTYLWSVKNGAPYQPNISGKGNGISINSFGEIELADSQYDAGEINGHYSGHTWKKYYFYYNDGNFLEYGGKQIDINKLLKIKGADKIVEEILSEDYSIDSIFYRENRICNINISKKEYKDLISYENISFRFNENLEVLDPLQNMIYDEGIYKKAFIAEIATYPKNIFK